MVFFFVQFEPVKYYNGNDFLFDNDFDYYTLKHNFQIQQFQTKWNF